MYGQGLSASVASGVIFAGSLKRWSYQPFPPSSLRLGRYPVLSIMDELLAMMDTVGFSSAAIC